MALSSEDRLVDDREYKDKDFHKGIITDYTDMVREDDVDWVWVKPGETLGQYGGKVGEYRNKSEMFSRSLTDSVNWSLKSISPTEPGKQRYAHGGFVYDRVQNSARVRPGYPLPEEDKCRPA